MTRKELVFKLYLIKQKSELNVIISTYIDSHSTEPEKDNIFDVINKLSQEEFENLGNNLGHFRNYCSREINKDENSSDKEYLKKLNDVAVLLEEISVIYQQINRKRQDEKSATDEEEAISQQKDVLKEINNNIKNFKKEIADSKNDIENINKSFNDKIFNVLINTVAILGIFVSIAFAGFGISSIFSNLDMKTALVNEESFVKNIFYLFLTGELCYNLILVLIYFIYKLSRPLKFQALNKTHKYDFIYENEFSLTPFLWIDGVLGLITIALFICSVVIW